MAVYRKLIAAAIGLILLLLNRWAGVDLAVSLGIPEPDLVNQIVELAIAGLTALGVWRFPNAAGAGGGGGARAGLPVLLLVALIPLGGLLSACTAAIPGVLGAVAGSAVVQNVADSALDRGFALLDRVLVTQQRLEDSALDKVAVAVDQWCRVPHEVRLAMRQGVNSRTEAADIVITCVGDLPGD